MGWKVKHLGAGEGAMLSHLKLAQSLDITKENMAYQQFGYQILHPPHKQLEQRCRIQKSLVKNQRHTSLRSLYIFVPGKFAMVC